MCRTIFVVFVILSSSGSAWALFAMPSAAPVDRLIRNTQAYIDEHPGDAMGHYTLGRIHYLAFSKGINQVPGSVDGDSLPELAPHWMEGWFGTVAHARQDRARELVQAKLNVDDLSSLTKQERQAYWKALREQAKVLEDQGWTPEPMSAELLQTHREAADEHLTKAIAMVGDNALFHLTYASFLDIAATRLADGTIDAGQGNPPADVVRQWRKQALSHYQRAFDLSIKNDLARDSLPLPGLGAMISHEAGTAILKLAEVDETLVPDDVHRHVKADVAKLRNLPQRAVTPIVLAVDGQHRLADLIDPHAHVRFDLDGDGSVEQRSWVRPAAGLLVWDPAGRGEITSGRQLFGSVTWWMFWRNGYAALDVLDDDRDGELAGAELRGMAVWFDRDGDAVSDPGEVVPVGDVGVVGLSVHAAEQQDGSPMNPRGVRFEDGRVLPTWDWIAPAVDAR